MSAPRFYPEPWLREAFALWMAPGRVTEGPWAPSPAPSLRLSAAFRDLVRPGIPPLLLRVILKV